MVLWLRTTILLLDMDLYEKVFKLVNSRDGLRGKFILRVGELHVVFAHLRGIGKFILESGSDEAWLQAGWFDSISAVKQIIDCKHMKRAVDAHEATLIAVETIQLMQMLKESPELFCSNAKELIDLVKKINDATVVVSKICSAVFTDCYKT